MTSAQIAYYRGRYEKWHKEALKLRGILFKIFKIIARYFDIDLKKVAIID